MLKELSAFCALTLFLVACGDDEEAPPPVGADALELIGVWASNFGTEEVVTEDAFNGSSVVEFDNALNVLITQNASDSTFGPNLFNKIEWIDEKDDRSYYCFADFGLATLEEAQNSPMTADPTDPDNGGCGMFPWTRIRRAIVLRGSYTTNFDGMETVTATVWDQGFGPPARLVDWSDDEGWVITQNDPDAEFNPDLYNRIEFIPGPTTGSYYYCTVDFGLATAQDALASTMTADPSDPENTGCGGAFGWTRIDPQ